MKLQLRRLTVCNIVINKHCTILEQGSYIYLEKSGIYYKLLANDVMILKAIYNFEITKVENKGTETTYKLIKIK